MEVCDRSNFVAQHEHQNVAVWQLRCGLRDLDKPLEFALVQRGCAGLVSHDLPSVIRWFVELL